jgi:hypothetical protein
MSPRILVTAVLALSIAGVSLGAYSRDGQGTGDCPQPRFTGKAPAEFLERSNLLSGTPPQLSAGRQLFLGTDENQSCTICHGRNGEGNGPLARQYDPRPRNFACAKTVNSVPDGQLFWIIRFGSPETAMPPHPKFSDEQIWQLVLHLRQLAK